MYFYESHGKPHIHAQYGDDLAVFEIDSGEPLAGGFPRAQTRLVQAWIEIHKKELLDDWRMAADGQTPLKVEPLK